LILYLRATHGICYNPSLTIPRAWPPENQNKNMMFPRLISLAPDAPVRRWRAVLLGSVCLAASAYGAQAHDLVPEKPSVEVNLDALQALRPSAPAFAYAPPVAPAPAPVKKHGKAAPTVAATPSAYVPVAAPAPSPAPSLAVIPAPEQRHIPAEQPVPGYQPPPAAAIAPAPAPMKKSRPMNTAAPVAAPAPAVIAPPAPAPQPNVALSPLPPVPVTPVAAPKPIPSPASLPIAPVPGMDLPPPPPPMGMPAKPAAAVVVMPVPVKPVAPVAVPAALPPVPAPAPASIPVAVAKPAPIASSLPPAPDISKLDFSHFPAAPTPVKPAPVLVQSAPMMVPVPKDLPPLPPSVDQRMGAMYGAAPAKEGIISDTTTVKDPSVAMLHALQEARAKQEAGAPPSPPPAPAPAAAAVVKKEIVAPPVPPVAASAPPVKKTEIAPLPPPPMALPAMKKETPPAPPPLPALNVKKDVPQSDIAKPEITTATKDIAAAKQVAPLPPVPLPLPKPSTGGNVLSDTEKLPPAELPLGNAMPRDLLPPANPTMKDTTLPPPPKPVSLPKSAIAPPPKINALEMTVPALPDLPKPPSNVPPPVMPPALPKLPVDMPKPAPASSLPSLTAITGGAPKSTMDILQPKEAVESKPLPAPGIAPALPPAPTLPKLPADDGPVVKRELPEVNAPATSPKPAVAAVPVVAPKPAAAVTPVPAPVIPPPAPAVAVAPVPAKTIAPPAAKPAASAAPVPALGSDGPAKLTRTVSFDKDKTDLSDDTKSDLNDIADQVKTSQGSVRIVAYASGTAEQASVARRISLSRALQIRAFLISKGVNQLSINVQALGNQIPSGDGDRADIFVK
jgi:outer membrane protein OmpA-like peptidoglycan-associated protein